MRWKRRCTCSPPTQRPGDAWPSSSFTRSTGRPRPLGISARRCTWIRAPRRRYSRSSTPRAGRPPPRSPRADRPPHVTPRRLAAVVAAALPLALAPAAHASLTQESVFQDDPKIVYATPSELGKTLDTLHSLGVDRIRVSVFWGLVAPNSGSRNHPNFNAADPGAYGDGFDRYDRIVRGAYSRGMAVNFNITGPAPLWVTGSS